MKNRIKNIYLIIVIAVILISFIPLFWISRYNCPSADDYSYAATTYRVWRDTYSVTEVIKEAVDTSIRYWNTWQGLYVSAFLLSLQPAIFGDFYMATGFIMLTLLIVSVCFFALYILKRFFGRSILEGITYGLVMSFMIIQYMPSPVEGIYWFNGAINYGFFFATMLIYVCGLLELNRTEKTRKKYALFIVLIILSFILEGGNHVIALMSVIYTIIIILCNKKNRMFNLGIVLFTISFFLLNICSPGTAIRQSIINNNTERVGVVGAIVKALCEAIDNVGNWIGFEDFVFLFAMLPIIIPLINYIKEKYGFKFKSPLLLIMLSVICLAIMYCPPFYAMNYSGDGRLINTVYYSYVILFNINMIYILGWISCRVNIDIFNWKYSVTIIALMFALLIYSVDNIWGFEALKELFYGEPQQYCEEYKERTEILQNARDKDVEVKAYSVEPYILYFNDISEDPQDWKNAAICEFYEMNSIKTYKD